MKQNNFNNCKSNLSTQDVYAIVNIIGKGCRKNTKNRLISCLTYGSAMIPNYGILERLMFENFEWSYCAGQSYTDEIRTIREIILKGA